MKVRAAPERLFDEMEAALGMPVVAFASGWRPDVAVDPDEAAARVLLDQLEELDYLRRPVALFVVGRGGDLGFSDLLFRASRRAELHTIVPYLTTGRVALAALLGESVRLGRYGAIGPFDGPGAHRSLFVDTGASEALAARILGRQKDGVEALSLERLGVGQGLLAEELSELRAPASNLAGEVDDLVWSLFCAYEETLGLRQSSASRYRESDVGDEVEWDFATGIPGAFVESASASTAFMLDTGRPDPDTGRLHGEWRSDDREPELELDFDNATPVE